ncbi:MAG: glucose-6-phosphate isomerase [Luminiphilus sp.]|nr:glucose-6-phosphate isomerase [Luminiphilus sp.]
MDGGPLAPQNALRRAAEALSTRRIEDLFKTDSDRAAQYQCQAQGLTLDFSKHLLDSPAWEALLTLADSRALPEAFLALISAETINTSEQRPALHTLLRGTGRDRQPEKSAVVEATLARMVELTDDVHSGSATGFTGKVFTDVVNLGIGGSDLGPRMICEALSSASDPLRAHFVANIDPEDLDRVLTRLDPATTLFVICSKSFSTEETLSNAARARAWLWAAGAEGAALGQHLIAVTTRVTDAGEWGIWPERCLPIWDWVGGRYSLWSAIGISIPLALGWPAFDSLLTGASALDDHTGSASPAENLPMVLALLELWQTQYLNTDTHAILPYAHRLSRLPDFLQQLTMESNGKRVSAEGEVLDYPTAPVLWGSAGTIGQHSYYQLLHQGTRPFTADIILPLVSGEGDTSARRALAAHALAQSRAFMVGRSAAAARDLGQSRGFDEVASRQFELPGNRSHSLIMMESVSPHCLGALIAAYEHKTYFLAVLMGLNPFDQWGVELGKEIAGQLNGLLNTGAIDFELDAATLAAAHAWRAANPD